MEYEIVVGLEVHAQLLTQSKIFCGCSTNFGANSNTQTCPVCLGLPGVLPVLNKKAVEFAIKTGIALNCKICEICKFDRKNYFYPDLPKNYQISQFDMPIAKNGFLEIANKKIRIKRIHLEEDAGKLIHSEYGESLVDFNRTGIPLLEIVSEPDISTPQEAKEYLMNLRAILQYLDVCDGNMEQGSFRCDANISIREKGDKNLGPKVELKNINSFKNVQRALEYEVLRQTNLKKENKKIIQETRLFDANSGKTLSMRSKEESHDYRYFPEPDLVNLKIDSKWIEELKNSLPELPYQKKEKFIVKYGLPSYNADILTSSKLLCQYFEECVHLYHSPKIISNWIMTELLGKLNEQNIEIDKCKISPHHLIQLLKLIDNNTISGKIAKDVFYEIFETGNEPEEIIKTKNLVQVTNTDELEKVIVDVLVENPQALKDYKEGKTQSFGFLVGQIMKKTKGKANPQIINKLLKEKITSLG